MGVMRFVFDPPGLFDRCPEMRQGYVTGMDGRVYNTRIETEGNVASFRRPNSESGKVHVPFPVEGFGRPVLTTASLPEREAPYVLAVELLRGKLSELRDQAAAWEQVRMSIPERFRFLARDGFREFAAASQLQQDPVAATERATAGLKAACAAADALMDAYIVQRSATMRANQHHTSALIGTTLDRSALNPTIGEPLAQSLTSAIVPIEWTRVEPQEGECEWDELDRLVQYCFDHRLILIGGPLISLAPSGLPEWLTPWANDALNLPSFVCDFIETAIGRYQGRIRMWEVSAYGNLGGALNLSEEQRLALVARTLETAYRKDSDAQFFVRVAQPWGEYQARGQHRLTAFQFVDALIRSNLGLTGVTLEIAVGYKGQGSLARDRLAISRMVDMWSLLGIQLHVILACPSNSGLDPFAQSDAAVESGVWRSSWSEAAQADWIESLVPMLAAKPTVTGVYVSHLSDGIPHRFSHAGLLRPDERPKTSMDMLKRIAGAFARTSTRRVNDGGTSGR
jgi:hypothetical protein